MDQAGNSLLSDIPIVNLQPQPATAMECERPLDDPTLRQGDIFAAHPNSANWNDPWRRFGVVLSADCDLAQRKAGRTLVYAPIVGLPTYLSHVWLPSRIAVFQKKIRSQFDEYLNRLPVRINADELLTLATKEDVTSNLKDKLNINTQYDCIDRLLTLYSILRRANYYDSWDGSVDMNLLKAKMAQFIDDEAAFNKEPARSYKSKRKIILNILEDLAGENRISTWVITALDRLEPDMQRDEAHSFIVDMYKFSNINFNMIKTNK